MSQSEVVLMINQPNGLICLTDAHFGFSWNEYCMRTKTTFRYQTHFKALLTLKTLLDDQSKGPLYYATGDWLNQSGPVNSVNAEH